MFLDFALIKWNCLNCFVELCVALSKVNLLEKSAFPHIGGFSFKDKYKRYQIKQLVKMDFFFFFPAVWWLAEARARLGEENKSAPSWPSAPSTR